MQEPFMKLDDHSSGPQLLYLSKWMKQFPPLTAGITSRQGGVSKGKYESLNCALHVHDQEDHVIGNRRLICKVLDFGFEAWTCGEQVHGNRVQLVRKQDRGRGRTSRDDAFQETDAMITNERDVLLTSFYADCVPLYFWDPVNEVVALAHAGWRGTALNIAGATISSMCEHYGSKSEHIHVAIGPSIGGCCYEVDLPVIERLTQAAEKLDMKLSFFSSQKGDRMMLDLKDANRQFMIKAGILPENIEISGWCTSCNTDIFYSHRKEQGATGRMAAWIGLTERGVT